MNNFDDGLYWYRRLDRHPEPQIAQRVCKFSCLIARELYIPEPRIIWFEKMDADEAASSWMVAANKQSSPECDPARQVCPVFRLSAGAGTIHYGFTPFEAPGYFFIQVGFPTAKTLDAVADECFHLYQDLRSGPDWRKQDKNYDSAEREAREFADSKIELIFDFVAGYTGN